MFKVDLEKPEEPEIKLSTSVGSLKRQESSRKTSTSALLTMHVGNLISGSSDFSKSSLNIWKFTVHILLKPGLENFEHHFTSV